MASQGFQFYSPSLWVLWVPSHGSWRGKKQAKWWKPRYVLMWFLLHGPHSIYKISLAHQWFQVAYLEGIHEELLSSALFWAWRKGQADTCRVRAISEDVQGALGAPEGKYSPWRSQRKLWEGTVLKDDESEPASLEKEQGHSKQRITNGFQPCQAMDFTHFPNYWAWVPDPVALPWLNAVRLSWLWLVSLLVT